MLSFLRQAGTAECATRWRKRARLCYLECMQSFSRRRFLLTASAALAAARISQAAQPDTIPKLLDHILIGSPDLDKGIAFIENVTGVRAAFGGVHPGAGTQNALLSLGKNRYLEIIAPDPKQPVSADARDLRKLDEPVIVGWAQHPGDIEAFAQRLKGEGLAILLVEQNLRVALALADRHHVMNKGEICFTGSTAELEGNEFVLRNYLSV